MDVCSYISKEPSLTNCSHTYTHKHLRARNSLHDCLTRCFYPCRAHRWIDDTVDGGYNDDDGEAFSVDTKQQCVTKIRSCTYIRCVPALCADRTFICSCDHHHHNTTTFNDVLSKLHIPICLLLVRTMLLLCRNEGGRRRWWWWWWWWWWLCTLSCRIRYTTTVPLCMVWSSVWEGEIKMHQLYYRLSSLNLSHTEAISKMKNLQRAVPLVLPFCGTEWKRIATRVFDNPYLLVFI